MTAPDRTIAVVLAAGLGTRMKSRVPKVLHQLSGRPMLAYVLDAAIAATGERPLVVYSPHTTALRDVFAEMADFALQDEPRGTGDAVRAAMDGLSEDLAEVVVLSGDVPLVDPDLVRDVIDERRETGAAIALVSVDVVEPAGLGRIVRSNDGQTVDRIVEEKDAANGELLISEVNAGLYALDAAWLRRRLPDLTPSAATGELYLTELVALARADGRDVVALEVGDDGSLTGINDRSQLAEAAHALQARINEAHMLAGVTMVDPTTAYVDATVELAPDVTLEPNVVLRGRTRIGEGTVVGTGSQIVDSVVGERCVVWASVLEAAEVEDDVRIGPFSHLRPGASIGTGAKLGNYAEVKASRLGPGVQQHHFSYIGDADVGEGTNVGAGSITCNYDGQRKSRTTIGKRVFLGSDTMLVAPITIGDGARTGAGSVVTHDVPAGTTVYGVPARPRAPREDTPPVAADSDDEGAAPSGSAPAGEGDGRTVAR